MKEIIIIGLVALLIFFAYMASRSGKDASSVQPAATHMAVEKTPVISQHESSETYYAVITEEIIEEEVIR